MKIAIIAHNLYPIREPFEGGLEMMTFLLCQSLTSQGHIVHLYAHENSDKSFEVIPIGLKKESLSLISRFDDVKNFSNVVIDEVIGYTNSMLKIAAGNYDIVHNHSLHYIPILIGNSLNVPMITSIHTPQFTFLKLGANEVKSDCNQTFTMVSKSLAKTWNDLIPHAKIVYNGIDLARWGYVANPTGDHLFWYGRICPEKGTDQAIQAAIKGKHKIMVAGPISNQDYYSEKVRPLLKSQFVEYVGHLSHKEIAPLLQNAKALLFTSTWDEPYGLTLAESLACGTPVVAYDVGATREILTEDCGVIIPKNNISRLIEGIDLAVKLNRADCRKRAENFCSHKQMVKNYLNLYESLVNKPAFKLQKIS